MKALLVWTCVGAAALASSTPAIAAPSSCVACHSQLDGPQGDPARHWDVDVHGVAGLGCEACHGGDPSPALAEDAEAAMTPARGFEPAPDRLHIPDFCARCHSDAAFMKQYDPQVRVDQLAEYRTSVHGRLNASGDPDPATCIDCHGVHGILPVDCAGVAGVRDPRARDMRAVSRRREAHGAVRDPDRPARALSPEPARGERCSSAVTPRRRRATTATGTTAPRRRACNRSPSSAATVTGAKRCSSAPR